MSLKTFVKIGKINNLSDARYCAGMMADILGFNLEEGTEGHVSTEKFKEITDWVAGVKFCGEFSSAHAAEIKIAAVNYPIDYIEVQQADQLEELQGLSQKLIFKLVIQSQSDIETTASSLAYAEGLAEYAIISCDDSNLFDALDNAIISSKANIPLIKAFDIKESIDRLDTNKIFAGIALEGSPEDRPGFKDYGQVMDILELLEED